MAISSGYITFFDKWVVEGSDAQPVLNLIHKDIRLVCIQDKFTCRVSSFIKYFDRMNNEVVKQNLLRQQVKVLEGKLDKSVDIVIYQEILGKKLYSCHLEKL
jgi:hypothetical protein